MGFLSDIPLSERQGKAFIADNGSQYGKRYAKALRDLGIDVVFFNAGVYTDEDGQKIRPPVTLEDVQGYPLAFIIGGKSSVTGPEEDRPDIDARIYSQYEGVLMNTCFGMHDLADRLDGEVEHGRKQCGPVYSHVDGFNPLFKGISDLTPDFVPPQSRHSIEFHWHDSDIVTRTNSTHNDGVRRIPPGYQLIAASINELDGTTYNDAIWRRPDKGKNNYRFATQFHPETFLTEFGHIMLDNVIKLSGLEQDTTVSLDRRPNRERIIQEGKEQSQYIRDTVGDDHIFLPLSGGIDSSVTAALVLDAEIPKERIHAFHIKTPYERENESEEVMARFKEMGWDFVELLDRTEFFENYSLTEEELSQEGMPKSVKGKGYGGIKLKDAVQSEHKRILFQHAYEQVQLDYMEEKGLDFTNSFAFSGSNAADIEESGGAGKERGSKDVVKTHHNVGYISNQYRLAGRMIEPMQNLYKQDIYVLGEELGLTKYLGKRRPYPGPGTLVRHANHNRVESGQLTWDDIRELRAKANEFSSLYGITTFVTPLEAVGVSGDERAEGVMALLQPERMDADLLQYFEILRFVAGQLPHYTTFSHQKCLTRFMVPLFPFDYEKLPEFTPTRHDVASLEPLRHFDRLINEMVDEMGLEMTQVVNLMINDNLGNDGNVSVVHKPWLAPDLMTGYGLIPNDKELPRSVLERVRKMREVIPGVGNILWDIGYKPITSTEFN